MSIDITGKIIAVLPERSGTSARGEWKSQDFVIETHDQYPRKTVFTVFGADRLARFDIKAGDEKTVSVDLDAHEWNGRWFNDIRAWNVVPADPNSAMAGAPIPTASAAPFPPTQPAAAPSAQPFPPTQPAQEPFPPAQPAQASNDDLPF